MGLYAVTRPFIRRNESRQIADLSVLHALASEGT